MDFLKRNDEKLAKKFSANTNKKSLRKFLIIFEYCFHGVPWFLIVGLIFFFAEQKISSKARVFLIGIFGVNFIFN
jgi:hypothetical protein